MQDASTHRLTSRCGCGVNTVEARQPPITRIICHCRICQRVYGAPRADVSIFWARDVAWVHDAPIQFKRYRLPPAVRRGTCIHCKTPVLGLLSPWPGLRLAFLPSARFSTPGALPEPEAHIFYHRRVRAADDGVTKISGYWPSECYVMRTIARNRLQSG